jgi:hypothetical protein
MERKKLTKLIISLFTVIIFITSYFAFGNYNPKKTVVTTTIPQTIPAFGNTNATIIGYGNTASISIKCNLSEVNNELTPILTNLEGNGSINNFYMPSSNLTLVYLGNMNPKELLQYLKRSLSNYSSCIEVSADTKLLLPKIVNFKINAQLYPIPIPNSSREVTINMLISNKTYTSLRILALLTMNGSIYNMSVSPA